MLWLPVFLTRQYGNLTVLKFNSIEIYSMGIYSMGIWILGM